MSINSAVTTICLRKAHKAIFFHKNLESRLPLSTIEVYNNFICINIITRLETDIIWIDGK